MLETCSAPLGTLAAYEQAVLRNVLVLAGSHRAGRGGADPVCFLDVL